MQTHCMHSTDKIHYERY